METPEKGFYYHYKHDPAKGLNDYAYEFLNVEMHTETDEFLASYRPIYKEAKVYKLGRFNDVRPLAMWMENVTKEGKTFPRFTKITDQNIIDQLTKIRDEMYW